MGRVKLAVHQERAVNVKDRPLLASLPFLDEFAGALVVFADRVVVDGIKILGVHAYALVSFRRIKSSDLLEDGGGGSEGGENESDEYDPKPAFRSLHLRLPVEWLSRVTSPGVRNQCSR